MINNRIKYELLAAEEEDLSVVGIYDTHEAAIAAMREAFAKVVGCSVEELEEWLDETDDAGIDEESARALDSVTEDGYNHDWQIIPLACDGDCRVATEEDFSIVSGIFNTHCDSGAVFSSRCRVNTLTKEVSHVESAGTMSEDDSTTDESVIYDEDGRTVEDSVYNVQRILDEETAEDALDILTSVKLGGWPWCYGKGTLDDAIALCKGKD